MAGTSPTFKRNLLHCAGSRRFGGVVKVVRRRGRGRVGPAGGKGLVAPGRTPGGVPFPRAAARLKRG